MAAALAVYASNSTLAGGTMAIHDGFNVSTTGTGAKVYNTGTNGTAIGLYNNTSYTVQQLPLAANAAAPFCRSEFSAFNTVFNGINVAGDII